MQEDKTSAPTVHQHFNMVAELRQQQQLHHYSHKRRRGYKELTSREEATTSTSHLGKQCSYDIGALQHIYHYDKCDKCTSCCLEVNVKEEKDILATCLRLYDVDIKHEERYMLNLPQPRLPTPTVVDGTTPTFPEWARELRAYLNINQLEHIDLLDFTYDKEDPLTTDITARQTPAGHRQHAEVVRLTQARQDLRDERAQPQGDPARRENHVIDQEIQQITTNSMQNKRFRTLLQQEYVEQVNFTAASLCMQQAEQRTEQPTSSTSTDQHRLGSVQKVETSIRCRRSCTAVHLVTERCTSSTSMERDIATTTVSKMDTRRLSLRDDTSCH